MFTLNPRVKLHFDATLPRKLLTIISIFTIISAMKNNDEQKNLSRGHLETLTSSQLIALADEYGIDYKLAIAISKHETGNYTSYAFKSLNNVGGMMYWDGNKMSLKSYNSLENGIIAFISNLKNNYIDLGLDTIEKIQVKYAPIGINDNGTNQYWVNGVYNYYNLLDK